MLQLDVEGNAVASLAGLEGLTSLLELYAGDNQLADMRQVKLLRWAMYQEALGTREGAQQAHQNMPAVQGATRRAGSVRPRLGPLQAAAPPADPGPVG